MKYLFTTIILTVIAVAGDLKPIFSLESHGSVVDLYLDNNLLYAGTDKGSIDIFNIEKKRLNSSIKIPKIKDFMGDEIDSKIYSIDLLDDKILVVSQGKSGFRNLYIVENGKPDLIISTDKKMFIKKAKFVDSNNVIIGLLSNEIILFNLKTGKEIFKKQISESTFSDFVLDEKREKLLTSDESGIITLLSLKDGKELKKFKGQNLDNVYQVDYKNGIIIGAGQDRKASIYFENGKKPYFLNGDFLIYSVGLSPSGNIAGYAVNEKNEISIFNTSTMTELFRLKGQKSTLTEILFVNESEVFTSSEDPIINFWKLEKGEK